MNFQQAVDRVQSCNVGDATKLQLYGLYKIATVGPCNTAKPRSVFGILSKEGHKWKAWSDLGAMSQANAEAAYIKLVSGL